MKGRRRGRGRGLAGPRRDLHRGWCSKLKGAHGAGDETIN